MIVDGHLDLAFIARSTGRDLTRTVAELRAAERSTACSAMASLPTLGAAGVAVVGASVFCLPAEAWLADGPEHAWPVPYVDQAGAAAQAHEQLDIYERWEAAGQARILRTRGDLDGHLARFPDDLVPGLVLGLEGADPVASADDLERWWRRGVRAIGLAWATTRYAGGTGSSAALTPAGRELLAAMAERGVIHDVTHLSEEAFWEAAGQPHHALCASHVNPRALLVPAPGGRGRVPLNRFLTDAQLREVARPRGATGGVVGLALLPFFLDPAPGAAVALERQVAGQLAHVAGVVGWDAVGIGSDVDAGVGAEEAPDGLDSVHDWARIGGVVPPEAAAGVVGGTWLRFLRAALPG